MNISNVLKNLKSELSTNVTITNFVIYDDFCKKIINKLNFIDNIVVVIPVCIRQEFYSHMVLFIKINNELIFFDPANKKKFLILEEFILGKIGSFMTIKYPTYCSQFTNCADICIDFLKNVIKIDNI